MRYGPTRPRTRSRAGSVVRRTAVALSVLVAVAVTGAATGVATEAAATTPTLSGARDAGQPAAPVTIALTEITPKAPRPGSTIKISGTVTNTSRSPLSDIQVRLHFSSAPLTTRSQLTEYEEGRTPLRAFPLSDTTKLVTENLAPKESAQWRIKVRAETLGLGTFGVYPLAVEALDEGYQQLGLTRTFLPFVPDQSARPRPTQVAWLWPIVDHPRRIADRTFLNDSLTEDFAVDGRLGRLVRAAAEAPTPRGRSRLPLAYAVDPQLLEDAQLMSKGYRVQGGDGDTRERSGSENAARWLDELRSATDGASVLSVPYGDPDMASLTHNGLDDHLAFAVSSGERRAEELLDTSVLRGMAWPPGGVLDQDTLDNLVVAGTRTAILHDTAIPPTPALTYTPDAVATVPSIGGPVQVLVADSTISEILARDTRAPGDALLAEQRFLAETALITAERPNQKRTLLVAPPRRWDPHPDFASAVLADTVKVPWLKPVAPHELVSPDARTVSRAPLRYPDSARERELGSSYLDRVQRMNQDVERMTSIVTPRSSDFHLAMLRTESSAWQTQRRLGKKLRRAVQDALDRQMSKVEILSRAPRTLASTTGTVPVTIANDLEEHSVTVGLQVTPRNRARLEVGSYTQQVTVGPERKETIQVPMTARATGVTTVQLQLTTPQGEPYGKPVDLTVRATGYGTVALVITGGAFVVLFLAIGVRLVRSALRSDEEAGTDEPTPEEPEEEREHSDD